MQDPIDSMSSTHRERGMDTAQLVIILEEITAIDNQRTRLTDQRRSRQTIHPVSRASIVVPLDIFQLRVQNVVKETLDRVTDVNRKATFLAIVQIQLEVNLTT